MNGIKATLALIVIAISSLSCSKILGVSPDSSTDVSMDSEEKIAELLTAAYPSASYFTFLEPRTDNVEERTGSIHIRLNEAMYFWEDYDQEDLDTPLSYWRTCYSGIAHANQALELLATYPKTPRVKALYGEALLLRAYLHYMIANIWAEPYGYNAAEVPGIPYVTTPEKHALVNYSRGTLEEVYEKIEADLKLGITLVDDSFYSHPAFHFNKKAAYAFAVRFYLTVGDWESVIAYADYVLGYRPEKALRDWERYRRELGYNFSALHTLYTSSQEPANLLLTTTESRIQRYLPVERYGMTRRLKDKIMKKSIDNSGIKTGDADKKYMFVRSNPGSDGYYQSKFDETSLSGSTSSKPDGIFVTNVLFTTEEVMLARMEAYAMKGEYNRAIDDLLMYLQVKVGGELPVSDRSVYTSLKPQDANVFTPFYGLSTKQEALIRIIADFRRKEFIHEGLRWFDIRRFHLPVTRSSRNPLYRPLQKNDKRKILQLPDEAILKGLEPNPRDI